MPPPCRLYTLSATRLGVLDNDLADCDHLRELVLHGNDITQGMLQLYMIIYIVFSNFGTFVHVFGKPIVPFHRLLAI